MAKAPKPLPKNLKRGEISKIRKKPGESNAGKYDLPKGDFAGPNGTFPINTMARARNALARAHYAENPELIRKRVYRKYPELKEHHEEREEGKKPRRMR